MTYFQVATDARFSPPALCDRRADSFARRVRLRNLFEYAAGAALLIGFPAVGWVFARLGEWEMVGAIGLCVAGVIVAMAQVYRRAGNQERRPEQPCRAYLMAQYRHQRDALASIPKWYLGPLLPGLFAVYGVVAVKVAAKAGIAAALAGIAVPAIATLTFFGFVWWVNAWAARRLDREIAALARE